MYQIGLSVWAGFKALQGFQITPHALLLGPCRLHGLPWLSRREDAGRPAISDTGLRHGNEKAGEPELETAFGKSEN